MHMVRDTRFAGSKIERGRYYANDRRGPFNENRKRRKHRAAHRSN